MAEEESDVEETDAEETDTDQPADEETAEEEGEDEEGEEDEDGDAEDDEESGEERKPKKKKKKKPISEPEPDDGIPKDLAYYVDKLAQEKLEKEAKKQAEGLVEDKRGFSSDSETDEVVNASTPVEAVTLRPGHLRSLQEIPLSKSDPYHEDSYRVFRIACSGVAKRFCDVSAIKDYKNLRCVNFGNNFIKDLTPFEELPFLGTLKLYRNRICGPIVVRSRTVRFLDLSRNRIRTIDDCYIPKIARLQLDYNKIKSLDLLKGHEIKWLRKLELRGNGIRTTAGINLPFLEELYLAENDIREIEDLENCPNLKRLHLRDNQIIEVAGFSRKNLKLEYVNLRNNLITFIDDAVGVCGLPRLQTLVMLDNPVQLEEDFRMVMIARMPTLKTLDKKEVKDYDRDWSIMKLLDCLYHEKRNLMEAVSDLMTALHPAESFDSSSSSALSDLAQKSNEPSEERVDYVSEGHVEDNLDDVDSIDGLDDDLTREYYKEPEDGDGDEEEDEEPEVT